MTNTRQQYDGLATTYLIIAGVVFGLIALAFAFMLVRYRASRDPDREPSATHRKMPVEVGYVVVLVLITAFLVTITFHTLSREDGLTQSAARASDTVRIRVTAAQWNWRFEYVGSPAVIVAPPPNQQPTPLYVPQNRPVLFSGRSLDVLHQFFVSEARFKRQVWPDHVEEWGMVFPDVGRFVGRCNWFCGLLHDQMLFTVIVLPPPRFDAWLADQRRRART